MTKLAFFNDLAARWDAMEDLDALLPKLGEAFVQLGVGRDEIVLDLGCGTGNLTAALLAHLSDEGRVIATDISPAMIALAEQKITDPRVTWLLGDAHRLFWPGAACHRVFAYSVWPHFDDPAQVAREIHRTLMPGGVLHVWHLISRQQVNDIHTHASLAVCDDLLAPPDETAALLAEANFRILHAGESDSDYLVTAQKPAP